MYHAYMRIQNGLGGKGFLARDAVGDGGFLIGRCWRSAVAVKQTDVSFETRRVRKGFSAQFTRNASFPWTGS